MRYHLTPVRMVIIKKYTNNKYWREYREKGTLLALLLGMQIDIAIIENSMKILPQIKKSCYMIQQSHSVHVSGENYESKRSSVHCSTIYNSQDMEATYMSISEGMGKEDVVHTYNGILLSHKKLK